MPSLVTYAAWILTTAMVMSLIYEIFRILARSEVSEYDRWPHFLKRNTPHYLVSAVVIMLIYLDFSWSAWVGLIYCVVLILVAGFYYNVKIMPARNPQLIDWLENLLYGGLVFSAATLLIIELLL